MLAAGSKIGQGKVLFLERDLRTAQAAGYAAQASLDGISYQ
jgi:hypothetical protein